MTRFDKIISRIRANPALDKSKKKFQCSLRIDRLTLIKLSVLSQSADMTRSKMMHQMLEEGVERIVEKLPPDIKKRMDDEVRTKLTS